MPRVRAESLRRIDLFAAGVLLLLIGTRLSRAEDRPAAESPIASQAELAAKAIQVPAGLTLKTVASEPNLANPVAFCFDPKGRIFVAETYRVGKGIEDDRHHPDWLDDDLAARTVEERRNLFQRHMGEGVKRFAEASEQVRLLEDRDGDGLYEFSSVYSDDYKNIEDGTAAGVMWSKDHLLFTCIPALWELRDADGDGKAEQRRALATGFGVHISLYGHDLHGLCEGPDGKIYMSIGDRGLNVETPEGRLEYPEAGAVLRCNPDGSELEIFARGLRNPQELAFNEFGDLFTVDNNSDAGDKARLVHVVEGMDAGWRMSFQHIEDRGPFNREKIWYTQNDDQPASIVPPLAHIADGPSGLVHYPGTGMPASLDGAFFLVDFRGAAATSGVREFHVEQNGATYRLTSYKPFISGLLATDCDFGPSGEFFVLDWVEGWNGPGLGRIQRFTSTDPEAQKQRLEAAAALQKAGAASAAEAVALLNHRNMRVRAAAQQRLVAIGGAAIAPLKTLAADANAPLFVRVHAIWGLGQLAVSKPSLFDDIAKLCGDSNAEVRAQTARTLECVASGTEQERSRVAEVVRKLLGDSSPRVRCFAAITLGKLHDAGALTPLLELAAKDGSNPTLRHAISLGLAGSQSAKSLVAAAKAANDLQRLVLVVALGKQKSPLVAQFLHDTGNRVVLEAARIIWDSPIPEAQPQLAAMIGSVKSSSSDPLFRRVLAANVAGRTAENLGAIIQLACRDDLSPELRTLAWNLVRTWPAPSPRDSVNGDWRPLAPRPEAEVKTALQNALPTLEALSGTNPGGLLVAAEVGVDGAFTSLLPVIANNQLTEDVRVRAVAAYSKTPDALAQEAIDTGLKTSNAAVRAAARKLLAERFPHEVIGQLKDALHHGATAERQSAIDTLASLGTPVAKEVLAEWLQRLENDDCPPELQIELLDAAEKSKDSAFLAQRDRINKRMVGQGPLSQYAGCLSGGDIERGRKIFQTNDTLACRRCHSVKPGEVLVGPCLADVGSRRKPAEILESVVTPNAKICEGFETAVLQLDSGKVITGIIRRETPTQIELIDANVKTEVVDPSTVENRVKGRSPMPDNLMETMTPRQLRDLIAFLSQLRAEASAPDATAEGKH